MSGDLYQTISSPSSGIYKEKGSKFLSFAYPVYSESEVKDILAGLKRKYHDARHFCFAYKLGADAKIYRDSDDGEPSNTAGKPIMRQLQSKDVTNILIVVIRYFGGILLGAGGLIRAYGAAASDALANAEIITKTEMKSIKLKFDYTYNKLVQKIIKEEKIDILKQQFEEICSIVLNVRKSESREYFQNSIQ